MCGGSDDKDTSSSSGSDDSSSGRTYGMSPGQAQAMGQGYQGGDTVGAPSGASDVSDYEQAAFGGSQEDYYNDQAASIPTFDFGDDDDDSASVTYTNPRIGYESGQDVLSSSPDYLTGLDGSGANTVGQVDDSFYGGIPTATQINAASGFTDDDEDYTPTSAELNAAIDAIGGVNLTDDQYAEPVDFTTTASGQDYNTVAEADTDVSGFEFVANTDPVTGVNTTDTLFTDEPLPPPPVDTTPVVAPVYTDSAGVEHSTQAAADAADAQYAEAARLEAERIEAEAGSRAHSGFN